MPFTGPTSYLVTIDEFIGHWTDVNAALAPNPIIVPDGFTLADLQSMRDSLADEMTDIEETINVWEGHRTDRDNLKPVIREKMRQLGAYVKSMLAGSSYVGRVRPLPNLSSSPGKWIEALDDYSHLWTTINAAPPAGFTPPLVLTGAYALADFDTHVTALKTTFTDLTQARQDVDRSRDERDKVYQDIRDQLVLYRQAVAARFPADHPLLVSLPKLSPPRGHTPDAVVLTGEWNSTTEMADLSWTASDDSDLNYYQIRYSPLEPYDTQTEFVLETIPAGTLSHSTNAGITTPGAKRSYKVYVVLVTGNERGSNAVTIQNTTIAPPPDPEP